MLNEEDMQLFERFHPFFAQQYRRILDGNIRFVHYTSAEAAMSIASSRTMWMRNARLMNDFSEIEYGLERVVRAYHGPIGDRFKRCIERAAPGLIDEIVKLIDGWSPHNLSNTYLMCVSEHAGEGAEHEDLNGRLSMWRAYGKRTSVALVLNHKPFLAPSDVLKAYSSPVLYADQNRFDAEFDRFTTGLEDIGPILSSFDRERLRTGIFNALHFSILCTKHTGFSEEREWRVIYSAAMHPSKHLLKKVEMVGGVPQFVYKIPLKNIADEDGGVDFEGAEIPHLLDRVIIGPSEDGAIVREAVIDLLLNTGVTDAEKKVFVSGIPLRN